MTSTTASLGSIGGAVTTKRALPLLLLPLFLCGFTMCQDDADIPRPCADGGVCDSPFYMNRADGVMYNAEGLSILKLNVYWQSEPVAGILTVNGVPLQCNFTPPNHFACAGNTWSFKVSAADLLTVKWQPLAGDPGNGTAQYYKFQGNSTPTGNNPGPSQIGTIGLYDFQDKLLGKKFHANVFWRK